MIQYDQQLLELQLTIQTLTKEKEFYLRKLRDIESFCQDNEDVSVIKSIMKILYATEVTAAGTRLDLHSHIPTSTALLVCFLYTHPLLTYS